MSPSGNSSGEGDDVGLYADTDMLLALIKDDDWLADRAQEIYDERRDELWTSHWTLVELMLVAYREDRDSMTTVNAAKHLLDVRGDVETVLAAASFVDGTGMSPLDALHLVSSGDAPIVSSDADFDGHAARLPLEENAE
jgi:predicted nucleic acid-binding protein